jgi:hypothetical protein
MRISSHGIEKLTDMRDLLDTNSERRLAKRVNLNLRTRLMHSGQQQGQIVIRDLSFTGFKGETDLKLIKGAMISVGLPNIGLVRATVQWSRDGRIAAAFHRPVDVRTCFRTASAPVAEG